VVRPDRAILAIDLGEDKQVAVLLDHDGRVLGRRMVIGKAYTLGGLLAWAMGQAARHGFGRVVVGCEPTGHRWRSVMALADEAGMGFVCVQSLRVHLAREADDYTRDKTDHKDAVLIGKLIARLDCYLPERADAVWVRLRHLGARRARLVVEATRCRPADRRSAGLLLSGGVGLCGQAVGVHHVVGVSERGRGCRR
jgi:transposase